GRVGAGLAPVRGVAAGGGLAGPITGRGGRAPACGTPGRPQHEGRRERQPGDRRPRLTSLDKGGQNHPMERIGVRTVATDVLVIGTGGAGLRTAIAAREAGVSVTVVGKRGRGDAHTVLAAGGINAALGTVDPEDSWQQHFADTYRESYGLSDPRVVEILTREAPAAVLELADWGCAFARAGIGRWDERYVAAHTYRRTCSPRTQTGQA